MHDYCLFLTFKIDSPVRFMLWIKFPDENAKHLFHVALTRRGKADFAPAYFLSATKISHLPLTFLPSCGIRLCLRRTSRLAGRLPRREPLLAVLPPAVLTDGSPFRKMSARLTCSILATFQIIHARRDGSLPLPTFL